jgi:ferric enterobactin receptor
VSEVLEVVPSVQVDDEGKVSLRGNENVVVQINGRPSPMRGEQLGAYLRQLPANTIDRVEVIPNPSARHDPEGMAGIINIVMRQDVDLGLSGGLTLSGSTADRYTASGNAAYQGGPLTAFLSYGFTDDERDITGINDRTRLDQNRIPLSFTEQDIAGTEGSGGHNLSMNVDYRLNERDVLSNALTLNRRGSTDASLTAYHVLATDRETLDRFDRIRDTDNKNLMLDYTIAFKRTFEPQQHELSAELRANRRRDREYTGFWRQAPDSNPDAGSGRLDAEINELDALNHQFTAEVDYTRAFADRTKLETGYRGNLRTVDRDFVVLTDSLGAGDWIRNGRSNALDFDELVNAAYGVLSHGIGGVELQAGLRAEHARRDFSLADSNQSFPHTYISLFPSGLASYALSEATQVKLSYSRRIRRPGTWELNPFPMFFDAQNVFFGNPELNPEYTDAIELGLQRSGPLGSVQVSPYYRRTTDIIRFIIDTADEVDGREVTSITFQNLDTGTSWGTDVNGTIRLGRVFSGLANFNIFKMVTEGRSGEGSLASDAVTWMARLNGTVNITPATSFQATYFYRAPMDIERGRFSSMSDTNFSIRHRFDDNRATVALRVSDPFNTMSFRVHAGDDNVIQLTERAFDSRAVHLTFQTCSARHPASSRVGQTWSRRRSPASNRRCWCPESEVRAVPVAVP